MRESIEGEILFIELIDANYIFNCTCFNVERQKFLPADICKVKNVDSFYELMNKHEANLRIIRIQPILEEINDAASEEDVYCEIRESRIIDCINQARPLTGRFNSNVKHFAKKCSTIRENVYNHLNYNQSLPNLCIGNEYEHAHANNTIGLLTNSENCLTELREKKKATKCTRISVE
ncbi:FN1 [Mytilus coruscus]|uniref:FN1 n=1 Tax=Mytilus coruscus TaxID=42192 RepID=A0A6J8A2D0_MYTCO|nr:FN1 [Mytilus coruscus]